MPVRASFQPSIPGLVLGQPPELFQHTLVSVVCAGESGRIRHQECTFTGLKDIFTALIESQSRTEALSPQRFLDIFKRDNEMFRNSMHQDG
ncbi:hypothetical protein QBC41DRAFT_383085, partial [Cercophora samala]